MEKRTETMNELLNLANEKGWKVIKVKHYTHEDDHYLMNCVVQNEKEEYVSYIFNKQMGFNIGYYFDSESEAIEHMEQR